MSDSIRADASQIAGAVSVFRAAADTAKSVRFEHLAASVDSALPGGAAIAAALDRACGAAAVATQRCAARGNAVADFAHEAHRFLEMADAEFADALGAVAPG